MGKPISPPGQQQFAAAVKGGGTGRGHGARHRRCPADDGSIQYRFGLHPRAALCRGGNGCGGGRSEGSWCGVWEGGEADCVLQGEGGRDFTKL